MLPDQSTRARTVAGFWRRLGAFLLDCMLLGAVGAAAGFFLADVFVRLGPWGRLLGFCLALAYFGTLNSRLGGGQSLGKRLLGIKLVGEDGTNLSVPRSFLRFLPLGAPWFLNNAQFPASVLLSPWCYVLSVATAGIGLSVLYLCIFNRATRQSLHDLLVGSYVVSAAHEGHVETAGLSRIHLGVCALLVLASGVMPYVARGFTASEPFRSMLDVQQSVGSEPWVVFVNVQRGTSTTSADRSRRTTTFLMVTAYAKDPDIESFGRAQRLAALALSADSTARSLDMVQITLAYGYDIGIASRWRFQTYVRSPAEWSAESPRAGWRVHPGVGSVARYACAAGVRGPAPAADADGLNRQVVGGR